MTALLLALSLNGGEMDFLSADSRREQFEALLTANVPRNRHLPAVQSRAVLCRSDPPAVAALIFDSGFIDKLCHMSIDRSLCHHKIAALGRCD